MTSFPAEKEARHEGRSLARYGKSHGEAEVERGGKELSHASQDSTRRLIRKFSRSSRFGRRY